MPPNYSMLITFRKRVWARKPIKEELKAKENNFKVETSPKAALTLLSRRR
jgi:hypothetical protein